MAEGSSETAYDIAIVGGGPAGLHAALKAARLYHSAVVLDKGPRHSRIFFAPAIHNLPGIPEGVSGAQLRKLQLAHIKEAEKETGRAFVELVENTEATKLARDGDGFAITCRDVKSGAARTFRARIVILATGLVDRQPYIGAAGEESIQAILPYANKGLTHYCLLCDGHEVEGKTVAVMGIGKGSAGIAETLRDHFGAKVTLVACIACALGAEGHDKDRHAMTIGEIRERGLEVIDKQIVKLHGLKENRLGMTFDDGTSAEFDMGFSALGWYAVNNELAKQMGAALDREGYIKTTEDCEVVRDDGSAIEGLFAVGDIRAETWNQIPVGWGDAETAVITAFAARL